MTWKITIRGDTTGTVSADYECPTHGRFTSDVLRDASGDPPAEMPCRYRDMPAMDVLAIDASQPSVTARFRESNYCGLTSPWRPSAVGAVRVKLGEVMRGKSGQRPSERYVMDTSLLADGMPLDEWKQRRAAVHRDESLRRVRQAFGKTPKVWSR